MSIKPTRLDPRIIRTRRLLRNALIDLIREKGFENITVKEITTRATLNKATFYLHYRDKEELLVKSTEQLIHELVEEVGPPSIPAEELTRGYMVELFTTVFSHFKAHAAFYDVILNKIGTPPVIAVIRDAIEQFLEQWFHHLRDDQIAPLVEFDVGVRFFSSALIGLVQQWLHRTPDKSVEQMANRFLTLITAGVYQATGLQSPIKG